MSFDREAKLSNPAFATWTRSDICKKKDNIVSTDWHEILERSPNFRPSYMRGSHCENMALLMSGEYQRMWHKERAEWVRQVFALTQKQLDMLRRRRKLQKEFREGKRLAEINIRERKERRQQEAEAKAKVEAETKAKADRLKAKMEACSAKRKAKGKKAIAPPPAIEKPAERKKGSSNIPEEGCPAGWKQVELTLQCECANSQKELPLEENSCCCC